MKNVLKNRFNNNIYYLFLLCFCLFACLPAQAGNAVSSESYTTLKKGKELLDAEKYDKAIASLKTAYGDLPVMRDYTLFFMAEAYNRTDRFGDSDKCIEEIFKKHADSPLVKRARALEIHNFLENNKTIPLKKFFEKADRISPPDGIETAVKYLEAYVKDYPEDSEMAFILARMLKKSGKADRAKKLFLRIYTGCGVYSEASYREIEASDITADVLLSRASNLMKISEYKQAEYALREALLIADDASRDEIQKKLGHSLFMQKRYRDASEIFLNSGDIYDGARSLYRTGDIDAFGRILSKLVSMEDKRVGSLLLLYASKKRRDGMKEEALNIFGDVKKRYPSHAEDALWGIAWTYFRSGDYEEARKALTELYDKYSQSKYLYWKNRAIERGGDSSAQLVSEPPKKAKALKKDFYSLLSEKMNSEDLTRAALSRRTSIPDSLLHSRSKNTKRQPPHEIFTVLERFSILLDLDMKEDAVAELTRSSKRLSSPEVLLYLCRSLQEAGAYKTAITLASRFLDEKASGGGGPDIDDILYPLAYWPIVSEIAERYSLDPFILLSVIREESRFDPDARSVAGALGLMQIMPQTARTFDKKLRMDVSDKTRICDARKNVTIGAYYLNSLMKEFGSLPAALAAYNAGEDKVREWLKKGNYKSNDEFVEDIPYDETKNYVKRVLLTYATYMSLESGD